MAHYLSLPRIVDELRSLANANSTGRFFVVSDQNHSASFGFDNGRIISLQCRVRLGLKAIPLIAKFRDGICRFEQTPSIGQEMDLPDNETLFRAILNAVEPEESVSPPPVQSVRPVAPTTGVQSVMSNLQKERVKEILIEEMGPMGSIVMDEIASCSNIDSVLTVLKEQIAGSDIAKSIIPKIQRILNG